MTIGDWDCVPGEDHVSQAGGLYTHGQELWHLQGDTGQRTGAWQRGVFSPGVAQVLKKKTNDIKSYIVEVDKAWLTKGLECQATQRALSTSGTHLGHVIS